MEIFARQQAYQRDKSSGQMLFRCCSHSSVVNLSWTAALGGCLRVGAAGIIPLERLCKHDEPTFVGRQLLVVKFGVLTISYECVQRISMGHCVVSERLSGPVLVMQEEQRRGGKLTELGRGGPCGAWLQKKRGNPLRPARWH
jgi:hypothetical protein